MKYSSFDNILTANTQNQQNKKMACRLDTPQQVRNNPSNDSTAKYLWTFPKSARFSEPKPYCNTISYESNAPKTGRYAGIGFGNRSTFFDGQNKDVPPPGRYDVGSSIDAKKNKGHSFGVQRDSLKFANYLKQTQATPSPLNYDVKDDLRKSSKSYTMRPKTAYPNNYFLKNNEEADRSARYPGPGKYETIDLIGSNKDFYMSTHRNQKSKSFKGSRRFSEAKRTPGPGDYSIETLQHPDGIYFLSNMRGHGRRAILNQKRQLKFAGNKETPGPGFYQKPSDFGHYGACQNCKTKKKCSTRPSTARK